MSTQGELRWTDSHCHLGWTGAAPSSSGDEGDAIGEGAAFGEIDKVLARARSEGVERIVNIGTDIETSRRAIDLAKNRDGIWATVGLHPHEASKGTDGLKPLLSADEVVAVGECGLDYHYDNSPREDQRDAFAQQILWANEADLGLVVHSREAWDDTFDILDSVGVPRRTVLHCFTGGPDEARRALDRNITLSFSGIVTFGSAADVQEAATMCPAESMLVETDAPFLAPAGRRGQTNEPAFVGLTGAFLADLRGSETAEIAETTWTNAEAFFSLR